MRVVASFAIVALWVVALSSSAVAQTTPSRPHGVPHNAWIAISPNLGLALSPPPRGDSSKTVRGQFMVHAGGEWVVVEPILNDRVHPAAK